QPPEAQAGRQPNCSSHRALKRQPKNNPLPERSWQIPFSVDRFPADAFVRPRCHPIITPGSQSDKPSVSLIDASERNNRMRDLMSAYGTKRRRAVEFGCLLLTQSGHAQLRIAAVHTDL